jgi:hypothetical protein
MADTQLNFQVLVSRDVTYKDVVVEAHMDVGGERYVSQERAPFVLLASAVHPQAAIKQLVVRAVSNAVASMVDREITRAV